MSKRIQLLLEIAIEIIIMVVCYYNLSFNNRHVIL